MKNNIDNDYLIRERKRIGSLIRDRRKAMGLTHHQLSEVIGINYASISKIENGKWNFGIDTVISMSAVLGFEISIIEKIDNEKDNNA